jgi:hypothetical protein
MSDKNKSWTISRTADRLEPGQKFIFAEDLGGEGEELTIVSVSNSFGTVSIETEELDFDVEINYKTWVKLA